MPAQSTRLEELRERTADGEIGYISKSKVLKWITCPNKFRFRYLKGYTGPETHAMVRGTTIHEVIEDYYYNVTDYVERTGEYPGPDGNPALAEYLPDVERWKDYTSPYIGNFLGWEKARLVYSKRAGVPPERWVPVGVEDERWLDDPTGRDDGVPWMGIADIVLPAESVPAVEDTDGVVIIDVKTGKTPQEKYRDEGIFLQGTYYSLIFEQFYDVAAVGGYYPLNDDIITAPESDERRQLVYDTVDAILDGIQTFADDPGEHFETKEGPLCKWGSDDDEECDYYGMCPATWGEGLKKRGEFVRRFENGQQISTIAAALGMSEDAAWYTKQKLEREGEI